MLKNVKKNLFKTHSMRNKTLFLATVNIQLFKLDSKVEKVLKSKRKKNNKNSNKFQRPCYQKLVCLKRIADNL
jgi:hypothetical protein